jgi:hypothetical protein
MDILKGYLHFAGKKNLGSGVRQVIQGQALNK